MGKTMMPSRGFLRSGVVAVAAASVALTGCSDAAKVAGEVSNVAKQQIDVSADTLYKDASAFAKAASSVEIDLEAGEGADKQTMNYRGSVDSPDYYMAMSSPETGELEMLNVDGQMFMKAKEDYWSTFGKLTSAQIAELGVAGKWVKSPAQPEEKPFDVVSIFEEDSVSLGGLSALASEVKEEDFEGEEAYAVRDRGNKEAACLYISRGEDHRPLGFTGQASTFDPKLTGGAVMRFKNWNNIEPVVAPAADEIVDLTAG